MFRRKNTVSDEEYDDEEYTGEYEPDEETAEPAYEEEEETVIDHSDRYILAAIIFEALFGVLVWLKSSDAGRNYVIALPFMILLTGIIGNRAYQHSADMKMFASVAVMSAMGIGLQVLIDQKFAVYSSFSLIKYLISVAIAVVFIVFYSLFRKVLNHPATVFVMMAAAAAIYGILAVYGYDPNGYGTNAWLAVGGYTIELTDFTKVTALLFYASLFSSRIRFDEKKVLIYATVFFLINMAGSLYIHELGSFFILFFLHLMVLYIYMDHSRRKRIYLISIFGLCLFAVVFSFALYKLILPSYEAGTMNALASLICPYVKKIYERFSLTANITADPYGSGYQLLQGKKAMWMAGLFGNTVNFNRIPVIESDMAFIGLIVEFGWPVGFLYVFLLCFTAMHAGRLARKLLTRDRQDSVVVFGAAAMLTGQGMMVILGSCNVIPFTGLPIPFLSRGFTYQVIAFCLAGILIHMSEERRKEDDDVLEEE